MTDAPEVRAIEKDGFTYLKIRNSDVHRVTVALEPCPCRGAKSASTARIRDALARALSRVER